MPEFDFHRNAFDVFVRHGGNLFSNVSKKAYLDFLMDEGKTVESFLELMSRYEDELIPGEGELLRPQAAMRFVSPPNLVFELAGPPGSGKSLFMNRLNTLLGNQCYWVEDKAREAKDKAVAQSIADGLGYPEDVGLLTEYYKDRGEDEVFYLIRKMNSGEIPRRPIVTERSQFDFIIMRTALALAGLYLPLDIDLRTNFFESIWIKSLRGERKLRGQERPTLWSTFMLIVPPKVTLERKPHRGKIISPVFLPILYGEYLIAHFSRLFSQYSPEYYLALNTHLRPKKDTTTKLLEAMRIIKANNFFPEFEV